MISTAGLKLQTIFTIWPVLAVLLNEAKTVVFSTNLNTNNVLNNHIGFRGECSFSFWDMKFWHCQDLSYIPCLKPLCQGDQFITDL